MKKHLIWIIELLIWSIIISVIIIISVLLYNNYKKNISEYYMFFDDVAGLTIGSPVRIMGKQVGYVSDIKIAESKVFVTFLIHNDIKIPTNTDVNVEFFGIAGSKSLELSPPKSIPKVSDPLFNNPKVYRISSAYENQMKLASSLMEMFNNISMMLSNENQKKYGHFLDNKFYLKDCKKALDDVQIYQDNYINNNRSYVKRTKVFLKENKK